MNFGKWLQRNAPKVSNANGYKMVIIISVCHSDTLPLSVDAVCKTSWDFGIQWKYPHWTDKIDIAESLANWNYLCIIYCHSSDRSIGDSIYLTSKYLFNVCVWVWQRKKREQIAYNYIIFATFSKINK